MPDLDVSTPEDRMVNGIPTCRECGMFSSASVCWSCSTNIHTEYAQIERRILESLKVPKDLLYGPYDRPTRWDLIIEGDDL